MSPTLALYRERNESSCRVASRRGLIQIPLGPKVVLHSDWRRWAHEARPNPVDSSEHCCYCCTCTLSLGSFLLLSHPVSGLLPLHSGANHVFVPSGVSTNSIVFTADRFLSTPFRVSRRPQSILHAIGDKGSVTTSSWGV